MAKLRFALLFLGYSIALVVELAGSSFLEKLGHKNSKKVKGNDAVQVAESLRAGSAGSQSVSDSDRDIAKFWLDARKMSKDRCNVEYVRELNQRLDNHKQVSRMANIDRLHHYALLRLMEYCGARLERLHKIMRSIVTGKNEIAMRGFGSKFIKWHLGELVGSPYRVMAEYMLYIVGYDKKRMTMQLAFMSAWENGPCKRILAKMREPSMNAFQVYVRMMQEARFDAYLLDTNPVQFWVPVIEGCEFFDESKEELANAWTAAQTRDELAEDEVRAVMSEDGLYP